VRSQDRIRGVVCACDFNHENLLKLSIIWSLAWCGIWEISRPFGPLEHVVSLDWSLSADFLSIWLRRCARFVPCSVKFCGQTRFWIGSRHYAATIFWQVPESCTDLDSTLLYISILRTYTRFVRENKMLALSVCFPQLERWLQVSCIQDHVWITTEQ